MCRSACHLLLRLSLGGTRHEDAVIEAGMVAAMIEVMLHSHVAGVLEQCAGGLMNISGVGCLIIVVSGYHGVSCDLRLPRHVSLTCAGLPVA